MSRSTQGVAPNVYRIPTGISNAYIVALDATDYVIIDAGGPGYGKRIVQHLNNFFDNHPPRAILLTHAHFDHANGIPEILAEWPNTPIYAHPLEFPFLKTHGTKRYPPGDPTVGGAMANLSRFMDTTRPTPLDNELHSLPENHAPVEVMPGWESIPTPGHTPGHVSFWNAQSRILISGDAIITMNPNNPMKVMAQTPEISGPPPYATYNWQQAERSAHTLAELQPYFLCSGHGLPVQGENIAEDLKHYVENFPVPSYGRYVKEPARFNKGGPVYVPPAPADMTKRIVLGAAALAIGFSLVKATYPKRKDFFA
jgi:glyoxylase-like metal-dependent hydrolase (beta-lactamase superfamily II)